MRIVKNSITVTELRAMARELFGDMVKAVVDVERRIMAVDGELHADEEALLLEDGSDQKYLWGVNIYPDRTDENQVEFDALINISPSRGNLSRGVENPQTRELVRLVIAELVENDNPA